MKKKVKRLKKDLNIQEPSRRFTRSFDIEDRMIEAEENGRLLTPEEIASEIAAEIEYLSDCNEDR